MITIPIWSFAILCVLAAISALSIVALGFLVLWAASISIHDRVRGPQDRK